MNEDVVKRTMSIEDEQNRSPSEKSKVTDLLSSNALTTSVIQSKTPSSSDETPPDETAPNDEINKDAEIVVEPAFVPLASISEVVLINDNNQRTSDDYVKSPQAELVAKKHATIKDDTDLAFTKRLARPPGMSLTSSRSPNRRDINALEDSGRSVSSTTTH